MYLYSPSPVLSCLNKGNLSFSTLGMPMIIVSFVKICLASFFKDQGFGIQLISLWNIFLIKNYWIWFRSHSVFLVRSISAFVFSFCSAELFFFLSETHFSGHVFAVEYLLSEGCNTICGLCPAGVSRGGVWADPGLDRQRQHHHHRYQCWGSAWSACFWASRIRIRIHYSEVRIRLLPSRFSLASYKKKYEEKKLFF